MSACLPAIARYSWGVGLYPTGISMRAPFALSSALSLLSLYSPAYAGEPPRLAVIPYLSLGLPAEEEQTVRERLGLEIASASTGAEILTGLEIKRKLPPQIPDGCPAQKECVSELGAQLGAD